MKLLRVNIIFQLRYITPTIVLVILVGCDIFAFVSPTAQPDAEPCYENIGTYAPIIEEFGSDYIRLQGNGVKLKIGDTYRFSDLTGPDIEIYLVEINAKGALLIVRTVEQSHGEPGSMSPHIDVFRCKLLIDRNDEIFKPRFEAILMQPDDLGSDWEVKQYTEFVAQESAGSAADETHVMMSAVHNDKTYLIRIRLFRYESEQDAIDAADNFILSDITYATDSTHFQSQVSQFLEGCDRSKKVCIYEEQYSQYRLHVAMHILLGQIIIEPGPIISILDWHYIIRLIEAKLVDGSAP